MAKNYPGPQLIGADLSNIDLSKRNFAQANLCRANLRGSNVTGALFCEACLQDADLTDVLGLRASQLRGADLTAAKLPPEIAKFEALGVIAEGSKNNSLVFTALLAATAYCWVTIGSTSDVALLTNSTVTQLPILQTPIPLAAFYSAAPILLFAIYLYFLFSLQILWESFASLPARFPDGRELHERAYPWLFNVLVRPQFFVNEDRLAFPVFEAGLIVLLAYWMVPITLLVFWWAGLKFQEAWLTGMHLGLLSFSIAIAFMLFRFARKTRGGIAPKPKTFIEALRQRATWTICLASVLPCLAFAWTSNSVFYEHKHPWNDPDIFVPVRGHELAAAIGRISDSRLINAFHLDLSARPIGWNGDLKLVKGADLAFRNLRFANFDGAFLANGLLRSADLREAYLHDTDLRGADLRHANLQAAVLDSSDLRDANIFKADFTKASVFMTNLQGVTGLELAKKFGEPGLTAEQLASTTNWILPHVMDGELAEAAGLPPSINRSLYERNFSGWDFAHFKIKVNLFSAQLDQSLLQYTNLDGVMMQRAHLKGSNLQHANLSNSKLYEADLENADLSWAALQKADLTGADLRGAMLCNVQGLSPSQIENTTLDASTSLPRGLAVRFPGVRICPH